MERGLILGHGTFNKVPGWVKYMERSLILGHGTFNKLFTRRKVMRAVERCERVA